MAKRLKISIVIPVHNQFNLLDQCLTSLSKSFNHSKFNIEVILSDSNSDKFLSDYYHLIHLNSDLKNLNIKIIRDEKNPGFSRAVNNGMKLANPDSDYYIWLNSDTIVIKDWLKPLLTNEYDLCSPISNNATYQSMLLIDQNNLQTVQDFIIDNSSTLQKKNPKVDFLNGFCYIISNNTFKTVGYLDEIHFPHYGSEDDYSLRAKIKGLQAVILCNSFVFHVGNQSYNSKSGSVIRKCDQIFLSRYPKNWFDNLILVHTLRTRNLRQQLVEEFIDYVKKES